MKDQYIGDINDFRKYGLLRALGSAHGADLRVCWMLTAADGRPDGARVSYLEDAARFRDFDAPLFDALAELVAGDLRSTAALQAADILPNARFHPEVLTDDRAERDLYFESVRAALGPNELVFFDPDNGLEVASVPKGARNSSKYLYWDELEHALSDGRTICIYQHFPRRPRAPFLYELLDRLEVLAPGHTAFAVTGPWAAFLLCAPAEQADRLIAAAAALVARPGSDLAVMRGRERRRVPA
jgi:hypothetical protein